jgi:hypothetical protein
VLLLTTADADAGAFVEGARWCLQEQLAAVRTAGTAGSSGGTAELLRQQLLALLQLLSSGRYITALLRRAASGLACWWQLQEFCWEQRHVAFDRRQSGAWKLLDSVIHAAPAIVGAAVHTYSLSELLVLQRWAAVGS